MPQTFPKSGTRHGLIENAAGQLICPTCRSNAVELGWVVVARPLFTVWATQTDTKTTAAHGGVLGNEGAVVLHLLCDRKHLWTMDVVQDEGSVTVVTEWEDNEDDDGSGRE